MMSAHTKNLRRFTVVHTDNDVTICNSAERLRTQLGELVDRQVTHICVDLSRASVIDSCVIGALVEYHVRLNKMGGELVIMSPRNIVIESLIRMQIDQVVRFVENESQI